MKRLVLGLLLGCGAYFGYRELSARAPAKAFESFAEAWARGRTEQAMALAQGEAVRRTLDRKPFVSVLAAPWAVDAFHGFSTSVVSSSTSSSGDLEIEARQRIAFDPPGATSGIGGAAIASFRHIASLRKTDDGWRVVAFAPECLGVSLTRGRPAGRSGRPRP